MAMQQMSDSEIRAELHHGEGSRRVRISRDGVVTYYGSPDPYDRDHDYTHTGGWREEYKTLS